MAFLLDEINERAKKDPRGLVEDSDRLYAARIAEAADRIEANLARSPIVLLSGPSGSGKTTTAQKVEAVLEERGITTHTISMDNYFKTLDVHTCPRTPEGDIDFESPELMDMDLLNEHFAALTEGKTIKIPYFLFVSQRRSSARFRSLRLKENQIVIFEGIHALNDVITDRNPDAFRLYISAASDIERDGATVFRRQWTRLLRRLVRDNNFRGSDAEVTLSMWPNVMRGEREHIDPFIPKANLILDSSHPCEIPLLKPFAAPLLEKVPDGPERFEVLRELLPALALFETIDDAFIKPDSLLREFIGGGIYKY